MDIPARAPKKILTPVRPAPTPAEPSAVSTSLPLWAKKGHKKPGPPKGTPKTPGSGRQKGTKNLIGSNFREIARKITDDIQVRMRILSDLRQGKRDPVLLALLRYAHGAPPDKPIEDKDREFMIFLSRYPLGTHDPLEAEMKAIGQGSPLANDVAVRSEMAKSPDDYDPSGPD